MDRFSIHIETQLDRGPAELSDISALSGKEAIRAISWVRAKKEMLTAPSSLGLDWEPGVKHQLHAWSQQRGVSRRGFESIQHVAETACLIEAWKHQKATESLKISENHMVLATPHSGMYGALRISTVLYMRGRRRLSKSDCARSMLR